jgi:hypothetical protein
VISGAGILLPPTDYRHKEVSKEKVTVWTIDL